MPKFERQKYLQILETQGVNAALTALHRDTERLEYDSFEGEQGYQPQKFEDINSVRDFARELWERALTQKST